MPGMGMGLAILGPLAILCQHGHLLGCSRIPPSSSCLSWKYHFPPFVHPMIEAPSQTSPMLRNANMAAGDCVYLNWSWTLSTRTLHSTPPHWSHLHRCSEPQTQHGSCDLAFPKYPLLLIKDQWLQGLWLTSLLCPWGSPGRNIGVGSHSLLQGIFPTPGSKPGLPQCSRFFTVWATRKTQIKDKGIYLWNLNVFPSF